MIHYHGTPLSGANDNYLALTAKHAMVSYAKPELITLTAELCQSFCLDNGAFSAWKNGTDYDFDGYREWADHWLRHPACDFAIIPDIIDGSEDENDQQILWLFGRDDVEFDLKSKWVPVWHLHESIKRLVRLAHEWPRIAFGSSGEYAEISTPQWWTRMAQAMVAITDADGFPVTKLHGLRMLDPGIFSYIPLSSADSTNVARNLGIDKRWTGPYVPKTEKIRAMVIMDRIESHACAARWNSEHIAMQANFDLIG